MTHIPTARGAQQNGMRLFDDLLDITEGAFVVAGNCLEDSVADIRALQTVFASLDSTQGAAAETELKRQIAALGQRDDSMQSGFTQLLSATNGLRGVMAGARAQVRSLGTIVRLIANISINARIQGNSLSRPKPQIRSFVDRIGVLSAEAELILSDVNSAMTGALDAVRGIEQAQTALSDELRLTTFPAIESFTAVARTISAEQPALHQASTDIAAQMQLVASDVAKLVTSLQIGDTMRQRLEQVHTALALGGSSPNERALSYRLAAALTEGMLHDSLPHIDAALLSIAAVATRGHDIAHAASNSALDTDAKQRAEAGEKELATFRTSLAQSRTHFATMQAQALRLTDFVELILGRGAALQGIAQQIRIAGINAVIACAKLGEDGRALRELAQWLRSITDDFSDTMDRLQTELGASRVALDSFDDSTIARLETTLSAFLSEASNLGSLIAKANRARVDVAGRFDTVVHDLGQRMQTSTSALLGVRSKLTDLNHAVSLLQLMAAMHPKPNVATDDAKTYLAAIRRKYTMASERQLNDRLVASLTDAPDTPSTTVAPPAPDQPTQAEAVDELDDILF